MRAAGGARNAKTPSSRTCQLRRLTGAGKGDVCFSAKAEIGRVQAITLGVDGAFPRGTFVRLLVLCLALAAAACSREMSDQEFQTSEQPRQSCFASVSDAIPPLIEEIDMPRRGRESGVQELRVTQRDQDTFVVDLRRWDSGEEGRGFFRERLLFERVGPEGTEWCHTRLLRKSEP